MSFAPRLSTRALVFVLVLAVVALIPVCEASEAKTYWFADVSIEAVIEADGDLFVRESRTAVFDGSFSQFWYVVSMAGHSGIETVVAYDSGKRLDLSASGLEGTYSVVSDRDTTTITIFFTAQDELRTFIFEYTLKRAAMLLSSVGYLHWAPVGEGWSVPTDRVLITVRYPEGVSRGDIVQLEGYGCKGIEASVEEGPVGVIQVVNVPASTPITCRTVFQRR